MSQFIIKKSNISPWVLRLCLLAAFFASGNLFVFSQNRKDLENKKKKLLTEINNTNELLNETRKEKKMSLNQLVILNKKISIRQELIYTINSEIELINKEIKKTNNNIAELQSELKKLKDDYARMIYFAYRNRDAYSRMMYVFASKDFNQAYLRLKYFQQYGEYRKKQAEMIVATQQQLTEKKEELEKKKTEKSSLLVSQNAEKENLTKEKSEKETVFAQLQDKEKQLKKDLEKKKSDADKLQKAIQKIIAEEIRKANEKAQKENTASSPSKVLLLTPEAKELSGNFAKNQGKLPWPVIKGIITERFGSHPHPLMPNIEVQNNGVDISTSKGALVRAVFDGEVTGIATVPGSGKLIIIRHGEYLSVYSNLNEVFVKQGDKITTKQNIGTVLYDEGESKTEMHLEIWKGQIKLDPEQWLFKN